MKPFTVAGSSDVADPAEFLARVWSVYDGNDLSTVLPLVDDFRRVANNRNALLSKLHNEFKQLATRKFSQYKQTSILLEGPRGKRPYLRANIWPTIDSAAPNAADLCKAYSYYFPHTHNFSFLTTNYFGSGYKTDIWELNSDISDLKVGDVVPMCYRGKFELTNSTVMLFESSSDVHTQYPPSELSISLNLMLYRERDKFTTQYFFDTNTGQVVGTSSQSPAYRRLTLIRMAEVLGTEETTELLLDIAKRTPDEVLRLAAADAVARRAMQLNET